VSARLAENGKRSLADYSADCVEDVLEISPGSGYIWRAHELGADCSNH
jgi:hypothetical protein